MKEPIVIQKLKRLAKLASYADLSFHDDDEIKYCSLYDQKSGIHTYPETYKELVADINSRIVDAGGKS